MIFTIHRSNAQVMPVLLAVLRSADENLREFLVVQLTALVALLRQHLRKWLPELLALVNDFWTPSSSLLPHLLKLISELAGVDSCNACIYLAMGICRYVLMQIMFCSGIAGRHAHPTARPAAKIHHAGRRR